MEIRVNDIVVLRSGGLKMVVRRIVGDTAECDWWGGGNMPAGSFKFDDLYKMG